MVHSVSPDYSITDELRDRAVGAESELAEFKRQIAATELIPVDVVTNFVAEDALLTDDEVWKIREAIKQFAAEQAKEGEK